MPKGTVLGIASRSARILYRRASLMRVPTRSSAGYVQNVHRAGQNAKDSMFTTLGYATYGLRLRGSASIASATDHSGCCDCDAHKARISTWDDSNLSAILRHRAAANGLGYPGGKR